MLADCLPTRLRFRLSLSHSTAQLVGMEVGLETFIRLSPKTSGDALQWHRLTLAKACLRSRFIASYFEISSCRLFLSLHHLCFASLLLK